MPEELARLFPILFPLFWVFVCTLIAHISGWRALAGEYRAHHRFEGQKWRFQSGGMRWGMGYNNCLTVGADAAALHLSMLLPFRAGHPPLSIPWQDVTVGDRRVLFLRTCRIEFRAVPDVPLTIRAGLADKLKALAGQSWPAQRIEPT